MPKFARYGKVLTSKVFTWKKGTPINRVAWTKSGEARKKAPCMENVSWVKKSNPWGDHEESKNKKIQSIILI